MVVFFVTIVYAVSIRAGLLDRPFLRDAEGVSAYYGMLARNYFRYDLSQTLGVPVCSLGHSPDKPVLYANHPPLAFMDIAVAYWLFGYHGSFDALPPDWQMRLVPACFCIACIGLIYKLLRDRACPRVGALAAALFAMMPITIVYGGHADVINPQLVFFALLSIAAYQNLHTRPSAHTAAMAALAFIPAGLSDWVAYYLLTIFFVHWLYTKRLGDWQYALPLFVTGTIVFVGVYSEISLARQQWNWFADLFSRRSSASQSDGGEKFTFTGWIREALLVRDSRQHTPGLLFLAALWMVLDAGRLFIRKPSQGCDAPAKAVTFCRLTLAWGIVHVFIGRQGVYNHLWWWWPLTPGIAISAAMFLESAVCKAESMKYPSRRLNGVLIAGLISFALFYTPATLRAELHPMAHATDPPFSPVDYGSAIRLATPPDRAVILADSDKSVCIWYYADRPIILDVWDAKTLEAQLTLARQAELPWPGYFQPLTAPPAAIVLPRAYVQHVPEFVIYLDAHFKSVALPVDLDREFLAYDLTTPAGPHFALRVENDGLPQRQFSYSSGVSPSRTASFVNSATE